MNNEAFPITPPPELILKWTSSLYGYTKAANWGADQELEACCEWIVNREEPFDELDLHNARRPKPPSLKELNMKHLEVMERDGHYLPEIISDLRRAIESLPS